MYRNQNNNVLILISECVSLNCMFRIQHKFDVEQVSEVFQVLAMRALSLVLFSRLTLSLFLSHLSISCLWLFVVGRR